MVVDALTKLMALVVENASPALAKYVALVVDHASVLFCDKKYDADVVDQLRPALVKY